MELHRRKRFWIVHNTRDQAVFELHDRTSEHIGVEMWMKEKWHKCWRSCEDEREREKKRKKESSFSFVS